MASKHLGNEFCRKFAIFLRKRINRGVEKILENGKTAGEFGGGKNGGVVTRHISMEKIPNRGVGMGKVDVAAPDPMIFGLGAIIDKAKRLGVMDNDEFGIEREAMKVALLVFAEDFEVAELRIDKDAHRVTVGPEEVPLTALEFKLLVTLIERRDRVQGRGTLLSDVWAMDSEIASRTVDTHVKRLRDKLGTAGRFIETVRGVGYRFSEAPSGPE